MFLLIAINFLSSFSFLSYLVSLFSRDFFSHWSYATAKKFQNLKSKCFVFNEYNKARQQWASSKKDILRVLFQEVESFSCFLFLVCLECEKMPRWTWSPLACHICHVFSCDPHLKFRQELLTLSEMIHNFWQFLW